MGSFKMHAEEFFIPREAAGNHEKAISESFNGGKLKIFECASSEYFKNSDLSVSSKDSSFIPTTDVAENSTTLKQLKRIKVFVTEKTKVTPLADRFKKSKKSKNFVSTGDFRRTVMVIFILFYALTLYKIENYAFQLH